MTPTRLMAWAFAVCVTFVLAVAAVTYSAVAVANIWPDGDPPYVNDDPRAGMTTTSPVRYCAAGSLVVFDATSGFSGAWVPYPDAPECDPDPIPPCESDDGSGPRPCRWDARTQGNGKGTSFTVTADGSVVMDR